MFDIKMPKDIQEGTRNRVMMIMNELERGNQREAEYQLSDLLDELNGALVVTQFYPPLDAQQIAGFQKQADSEGYARGLKAGYEKARKELRAEINSRLVGVL